MPAFEYAFLCDYARVEANLASVVGMNIDTIAAPSVPIGQNIGIGAAIRFTKAEAEEDVRVPFGFTVRHEDEFVVTQFTGDVWATQRPDVDPDWPMIELIGINTGLYLPAYGRYEVQFALDGEPCGTLVFRVIPPDDSPSADES